MIAIGLTFTIISGGLVTIWASPMNVADMNTNIGNNSFVIENGVINDELCAEHIVIEKYDDLTEYNKATNRVCDENWKYAPDSYDRSDRPFVGNCVLLRVDTDASFSMDAEHIITVIQKTAYNSFYIQYDSEEAAKNAVELLEHMDSVEYAVQDMYGLVGFDSEVSYFPFEDVSKADWFYPAVSILFEEKIMMGPEDGIFGPYESLSRAQFVVIMHRMENEPEFKTEKTFIDITGDEWYGSATLWAAENSIVTGYKNGYFGPADCITREQLCTIMYRYADYLKKDVTKKADINKFEDAESVSDFAVEAMSWAYGSGIITGKENGTLLDPQGNATRCEAAVIIQRFMGKIS